MSQCCAFPLLPGTTLRSDRASLPHSWDVVGPAPPSPPPPPPPSPFPFSSFNDDQTPSFPPSQNNTTVNPTTTSNSEGQQQQEVPPPDQGQPQQPQLTIRIPPPPCSTNPFMYPSTFSSPTKTVHTWKSCHSSPH